MGHSTNKINKTNGVSISDINTVLEENSTDLGTLCKSSQLNLWAKFKPYRDANTYTDEGSRVQAHYGLSIEHATDLGSPTTANTFLYKLVNGQLDWNYLKPRGRNGGSGGANEWYRELDFVDVASGHTNGYYHDAVCPVGDPVTTIPIDNYGNCSINWDLISNLDSGNLTFDDIVISQNNNTKLTEYYLAVLLKNSNSYHLLSSSTKLGTGSVTINLSNATSLANGTGVWTAYPFFSSVPITFDGSITTGSYVSAGWDKAFPELTFTLSNEYIEIIVDGTWNSTYTAVDVSWTALNYFTTQKSTTATVNIRKNQNASQEPASENDQLSSSVSLGTIVIPAASGNTPGTATGTTTINASTMTDGPYSPDYVWWTICTIPNFATCYNQIEDYDPPISE